MSSTGDKLTYFLVGGFVGAAIALLFAPRSGEETRQYLEGKYREGTEKLSQKTAESREMLKEKASWLTEKAKEQTDAVGEKSRDVISKVSGSLEKGKEAVQKQRDQLAKAVEAGKQAYKEEKQRLGVVEQKSE